MINHEDIANIKTGTEFRVMPPNNIADIYRAAPIMVQLKGEMGGYRPVYESLEIPGMLCIINAQGERESFTEPTEAELCTAAGIAR